MNFTRIFSNFFTRMYSYVPVCYSYVSRIYPYVPICSVCYSYVTHMLLVCYPLCIRVEF